MESSKSFKAVRFGVHNRGVFHVMRDPGEPAPGSYFQQSDFDTLCGVEAEGRSPVTATLATARDYARVCKRCDAELRKLAAI